MKPKPKPKVKSQNEATLTVNLTRDLLSRLTDRARVEDRSVSAVVRIAALEYLERARQESA